MSAGDTEDGLVSELRELARRTTVICNKLIGDSGVTLAVSNLAPNYGAYARSIIRGRARLRRWLDADLIADPAFEILLDLYASGEEKSAVCLSGVGVRPGVPASTVLRWVELLEERGLIARSRDPDDGERFLLHLKSHTRELLSQWFAEISAASPPPR